MNEIQSANSCSYAIFIAGDYHVACQVCREWCFEVGGCVTIDPTRFIYTGGEESGVRIGFINYPRFPSTEEAIRERAHDLASRLLQRLYQHSYSIIGPRQTEWFSRRPAPTAQQGE